MSNKKGSRAVYLSETICDVEIDVVILTNARDSLMVEMNESHWYY
jgi:hypothetical protein